MPRQSKELTRAQIENATIRLFRECGYNDISMAEIAKKAGISKRTLYKYYPSKIALFISVFEQNLTQLMSDETQADYEQMNFTETLLYMFTTLYNFTDRNLGFMWLFWMLNNDAVEGDIPDELLQHVYQLNNKIMENAAEQLAKKSPTGIFQKMSPNLITQTYSAMNKGIFIQAGKESGIGINNVTQQELFESCCEMLRYCAK